MNNLHRELAPISDDAWAQIEEEAARTFKRYLAGRRVVDVAGPSGEEYSAVGPAGCARSTRPAKACGPAAAGRAAGRAAGAVPAGPPGDR